MTKEESIAVTFSFASLVTWTRSDRGGLRAPLPALPTEVAVSRQELRGGGGGGGVIRIHVSEGGRIRVVVEALGVLVVSPVPRGIAIFPKRSTLGLRSGFDPSGLDRPGRLPCRGEPPTTSPQRYFAVKR